MKATDVPRALRERSAKISDSNTAAYLELAAVTIDTLMESVGEERKARLAADRRADRAAKEVAQRVVEALGGTVDVKVK